MSAPADLESILDKYEQLGRLDEDLGQVDQRLHAAVEEAAVAGHVTPQELGVGDWAQKTLQRIKAAIHAELCDPEKGKVKDKYLELLNKGTSKEGIASISAVITSVMVALNLAPLAVSSVILYLAIWLVKIGLNSWCSLPQKS